MSDLILLKNQTFKEIRKPRDIKGRAFKKKVSAILLDLHSDILGDFKYEISYDSYKRLSNIDHFKLAYTFVNGEDTGEDDEVWNSMMNLEYAYEYTDFRKLIVKYIEMALSETTLNDYFWVRNCFYCFYYSKTRIKIKEKGKSKYIKFYNWNEFFSHIKFSNDEPFSDMLRLKYSGAKGSDNKWTVPGKLKVKNDTYICLYNHIYVKCNKPLNNIEWFNMFVTNYITDDDIDLHKLKKKKLANYEDTAMSRVSDGRPIKSFEFLFELPMTYFILDEIYESNYVSYVIDMTTEVKYADKKKPKSVEWESLRNQVFQPNN